MTAIVIGKTSNIIVCSADMIYFCRVTGFASDAVGARVVSQQGRC